MKKVNNCIPGNIKVFWTKGFRTFILFFVPLYRINSNNYRFYNRLLIESNDLMVLKCVLLVQRIKKLNEIALISTVGGKGYFNFREII